MTIVKFQRGFTQKKYRQELQFLWSAHHLMMLYISLMCHDTILNDFQAIERTQKDHCQISKGNNSKMYIQELQFLWSACCLMMLSMKFHENILNVIQVIEWTGFSDRQTNGQTDEQTTKAKTVFLHPFIGVDIMNCIVAKYMLLATYNFSILINNCIQRKSVQ